MFFCGSRDSCQVGSRCYDSVIANAGEASFTSQVHGRVGRIPSKFATRRQIGSNHVQLCRMFKLFTYVIICNHHADGLQIGCVVRQVHIRPSTCPRYTARSWCTTRTRRPRGSSQPVLRPNVVGSRTPLFSAPRRP